MLSSLVFKECCFTVYVNFVMRSRLCSIGRMICSNHLVCILLHGPLAVEVVCVVLAPHLYFLELLLNAVICESGMHSGVVYTLCGVRKLWLFGSGGGSKVEDVETNTLRYYTYIWLCG